MKIKRIFYALAGLCMLMSSCSAPKDVIYFENIQPGKEIQISQPVPLRLEPNDKLSIIVSTPDARLNTMFNLPVTTTRISGTATSGTPTSSSSDQTATYTISKSGDIMFPSLGKLHIAGMTRDEVAEYIRREIISRDLAKNPIVTVEFTNLAVSVMGEVGHPGRQGISREDYTIIDALAAAGDLTVYGRRDNIKVIRTENGVQKAYLVDITKGDELARSPVYYVRPNDVIYVEPNNTKKRQATPNGNLWSTPGIWISLVSSGLSIATMIITLTK